MIYITLKTICISLLLIVLIHYLYGFFKNTLTVPKVKDLVNNPTKRYNEMYNLINRESSYRERDKQQQQQKDLGEQNMQAELNSFLNDLKKPASGSANTSAVNKNAVSFPTDNASAFGSYTPF